MPKAHLKALHAQIIELNSLGFFFFNLHSRLFFFSLPTGGQAGISHPAEENDGGEGCKEDQGEEGDVCYRVRQEERRSRRCSGGGGRHQEEQRDQQ